MQPIDYLPINNGNLVTVELTTALNDAKSLPKDASGNEASKYLFQVLGGNVQIRLDATAGTGTPNFVSKFVLLEGQSLIVQCEGDHWAFVDALTPLPVSVFITALDTR